MTDGEENASLEYTAEIVRELVKQQTEQYDWDFMFLGADQDAVLTAAQLGIGADKALTFARGTENVRAMTGALTAKLRSVRAGSRDHMFTEEERFAAAGVDSSESSLPDLANMPAKNMVDPGMVRPGLLAVTEIVDHYGVSRKTLQRWITAGKIVPVKTLPGQTGAHLFDEADMEALFRRWHGRKAVDLKG